MNYAAILKEKLNQKRALIVPGAANALAARVIESMGFEAIYLSGAGLTNTFYGLPDLGFINLNDLASHTSAIKDAVALPLIVDADTGLQSTFVKPSRYSSALGQTVCNSKIKIAPSVAATSMTNQL